MEGGERNYINQCLRMLLRPLVEFCLKHGLKYQDFQEASKSVFVEEAISASDKAEPSQSQLSAMTGLQRRDIQRLQKEEAYSPYKQNLLAKVIGHWENSKSYTDQSKAPKVLQTEGDKDSFRALVKEISQDIDPKSILRELERLDMVENSDKGVRLLKAGYQIGQDKLEGLNMMARDCSDFNSAVQENLFESLEIPNLHARTEFDNISRAHIPEIKNWLLNKGSEFHKEARRYLSDFDLDLNPTIGSPGKTKVILGVFSRVIKENNETD